MITFKCNYCLFEFSEADKAWDKAIKTGCCPKCKKKHSELDLNGQFTNESPISSGLNNSERIEIPKWIKAFGWFFIVAAIAAPLTPFILSYLNQPVGRYGIFGVSYQGAPDSPIALLILSVWIALGVAAFGLLFHKSWGVNACLIMAYISIAICIFTMAYSFININASRNSQITLRLELLILIPYLKWLHKVKSE